MEFESPLLQTLIASAAMLIVALLVLLIYERSPGAKSPKSVGDSDEPYLGGEKQPFADEPVNSSNLFWSTVNQSLKNVYKKAIDRFNTYSIDQWLLYMSVWLVFLIVLLIILVVVL